MQDFHSDISWCNCHPTKFCLEWFSWKIWNTDLSDSSKLTIATLQQLSCACVDLNESRVFVLYPVCNKTEFLHAKEEWHTAFKLHLELYTSSILEFVSHRFSSWMTWNIRSIFLGDGPKFAVTKVKCFICIQAWLIQHLVSVPFEWCHISIY